MMACIFTSTSLLESSAVGVLAILGMSLMVWASGYGSAVQAAELAFAAGWIALWSSTNAVLIETPGLLISRTGGWGAVLAIVLGVGLLALAWRRRSRLVAGRPDQRPIAREVLAFLVCVAVLTLIAQLSGSPTLDWIVATVAWLLYAVLARRGRVPQAEA